MKAYYVDLVRGSKFTFIAGPFRDEATARRYQPIAVSKAVQLDPWRKFDDFGVTSINCFVAPGELNDELDIPAQDLLPMN